MSLSDDLELIAEHIGDDQPNLPAGAKNSLLMAAKALRKLPVYADTGKPFVPTIDKAYSLIQSSLLKAGFVITDGESFISWDANGEIEAEFAGEWWKAAGCYSTPQAAEKASKA